jgi:REP element-mobilizing transposase RayT
MVRGIERRRIFLDDCDRLDWVARMQRLLAADGGGCLAWALMPNHVHMLLRTGNTPLSRIMARLNTGYAVVFNRRHERSGHLFQNRFKSRMAVDDADVMNLIRYIHRNPLDGGLVPSFSALGDFRWCGHGALSGLRHPHAFESVGAALTWFGDSPLEARRNLARWMALGAQGPDPLHQLYVELDPGPDPPREQGENEIGEMLQELMEQVCRRLRVDAVALRGARRRRDVSQARAAIAFIAIHRLGLPAARLSGALGLSRSGVSRAAARGGRTGARGPGARASQQIDQRPR